MKSIIERKELLPKKDKMKKRFFLILLMSVIAIGSYAQENTEKAAFNKWSIDIGAGVNNAYRNFEPGYSSACPGFWTGTVGVRYMVSEYFGLRAGFGFDSFDENDNSNSFDSEEYNFDLQGVINLGRVLNFHDWTKTLNLLAHGGLGVGICEYGDNDNEYVGYPVAGLTAEIKLSPRIVLFADGSMQKNFRQQSAFDGGPGNDDNVGGIVRGTIGFSISLGKQKQRADFYYYDNRDAQLTSLKDQINALSYKVDNNSGKINDNANTADELQSDVDELTNRVNSLKNISASDYDDMAAELINNGFLNIYFTFNSTRVESYSTKNVAFLKSYMEKNPEAKVSLSGYADEMGTSEYNQILSQKRADVVAKLLQNSGIDSSKINAEGKGEFSVDPNSSDARKIARKVSFAISK